MITNIIITLYEFNPKVERQIVLGANKNSYLKGIEKIQEKEVCFRTHFSLSSAKEIQGERDGRASG